MFSALVFKRACKAYSILVDSTSCKRSSHKGTNMASLVGSAASGSQKRLDESTYTVIHVIRQFSPPFCWNSAIF